jgi:hypothetical protein
VEQRLQMGLHRRGSVSRRVYGMPLALLSHGCQCVVHRWLWEQRMCGERRLLCGAAAAVFDITVAQGAGGCECRLLCRAAPAVCDAAVTLGAGVCGCRLLYRAACAV